MKWGSYFVIFGVPIVFPVASPRLACWSSQVEHQDDSDDEDGAAKETSDQGFFKVWTRVGAGAPTPEGGEGVVLSGRPVFL